MLDNELIKRLNMASPSVWLATWFGFGFIKKAPGTMGTIGALPLGLLLLYTGGPYILLYATLLAFITGYFAAKNFDKMAGGHDNKAIVIDEVVGIWIALLPVLWTSAFVFAVYAFLAFCLFRFFDIVKPWPIGWVDRKLSGAWGVMLDDVLAGIFAAIIITGVRFAGFG